MTDLIETLSDYVHQAWIAEKLKQGFADHPWHEAVSTDGPMGRCDRSFGDDPCWVGEAMHHTDMLPYAELPEHIKEYDRVTVRAVLEGIEKAGYRLWPQS